jgi:hypothetical protein
MRARPTLIVCLLLAACGGEPEQNVSMDVPSPATPTPAPVIMPEPTPTPEPSVTPTPMPTPTETAATGPVSAIPAAWRGTWAGSDGCGRAATMRLRVGADRLTFFESEGRATKIERRSPRELSMLLEMTGEGESWTRRATLTLSPDGERLTRTEAGTDAVSYTKCGS